MQHLDAAYHLLTDENIQLLYQINVIRSFLIAVSITRHGDLTLQIALIGYYSFMRMQNRLSLRAVDLSLHSTFIRQHLQRIGVSVCLKRQTTGSSSNGGADAVARHWNGGADAVDPTLCPCPKRIGVSA